ncbi:hypothetical protein STENM327S_08384 [Streptomyces tendae]
MLSLFLRRKAVTSSAVRVVDPRVAASSASCSARVPLVVVKSVSAVMTSGAASA